MGVAGLGSAAKAARRGGAAAAWGAAAAAPVVTSATPSPARMAERILPGVVGLILPAGVAGLAIMGAPRRSRWRAPWRPDELGWEPTRLTCRRPPRRTSLPAGALARRSTWCG